MSNKDERSSHFLLGVGIGAVLGVLFAPRSGENTRKRLREVAEDYAKKKEELSGDFKNAYEKAKGKVEPKVNEVVSKVSPYLEAAAELSEPYRKELVEDIKSLVESKVGKKNVKKVKKVISDMRDSA